MILNYLYSKQEQNTLFTLSNAVTTFPMQPRPEKVAHKIFYGVKLMFYELKFLITPTHIIIFCIKYLHNKSVSLT